MEETDILHDICRASTLIKRIINSHKCEDSDAKGTQEINKVRHIKTLKAHK